MATLELVHQPDAGPVETGGFDHLAIQVDDLAETLATLTELGLAPGEPELPGGPEGPKTVWLVDPDGNRIELVEWPAGHPYSLTAADFPDVGSDIARRRPAVSAPSGQRALLDGVDREKIVLVMTSAAAPRSRC